MAEDPGTRVHDEVALAGIGGRLVDLPDAAVASLDAEADELHSGLQHHVGAVRPHLDHEDIHLLGG